jgi:hypothetical protein
MASSVPISPTLYNTLPPIYDGNHPSQHRDSVNPLSAKQQESRTLTSLSPHYESPTHEGFLFAFLAIQQGSTVKHTSEFVENVSLLQSLFHE